MVKHWWRSNWHHKGRVGTWLFSVDRPKAAVLPTPHVLALPRTVAATRPAQTGGLGVRACGGLEANLASGFPNTAGHQARLFRRVCYVRATPGNPSLELKYMRPFKPYTSDAEIAAIGAALINRTLPKAEWTHAAHFAAVLWLIACRPDIDVAQALPCIIRAYNEATGVANTANSGYHETITQASIRAARVFYAVRRNEFLYRVCNELLGSRLGDPAWLLEYWRHETLFSEVARRRWVGPDIKEAVLF
jgi:hypothetical protein